MTETSRIPASRSRPSAATHRLNQRRDAAFCDMRSASLAISGQILRILREFEQTAEIGSPFSTEISARTKAQCAQCGLKPSKISGRRHLTSVSSRLPQTLTK